jgi:hypothetical protein
LAEQSAQHLGDIWLFDAEQPRRFSPRAQSQSNWANSSTVIVNEPPRCRRCHPSRYKAEEKTAKGRRLGRPDGSALRRNGDGLR